MAAFSCLSYCLAYAFVVVFSKIHRFCSIIISVVCGSRAEVVLRPIFVTWLCRACAGTRGLISLNFPRPGLVSTMFCDSRGEVVLRQFFVTWLCRTCVRTRGLISLNFSRPGLVYTVFCVTPEHKLFCGNFCYLTLLSVCYNQGFNFAKIFTPWSCLRCVLWLQSKRCFAAFCFLTLSSVFL